MTFLEAHLWCVHQAPASSCANESHCCTPRRPSGGARTHGYGRASSIIIAFHVSCTIQYAMCSTSSGMEARRAAIAVDSIMGSQPIFQTSSWSSFPVIRIFEGHTMSEAPRVDSFTSSPLTQYCHHYYLSLTADRFISASCPYVPDTDVQCLHQSVASDSLPSTPHTPLRLDCRTCASHCSSHRLGSNHSRLPSPFRLWLRTIFVSILTSLHAARSQRRCAMSS